MRRLAHGLVARAMALALLGAGAPARAVESAGGADAPDATPSGPTATWRTDARGQRFRVAFDPGHRVLWGAGAGMSRDAGGTLTLAPTIEIGLLLRSLRPGPGWDVFWTAHQELGRLRLSLSDGTLDGRLYRCLLLRESREGTLTFPGSPPVAISLPFDIGLLFELGEARGAAWPTRDGARVAELGVVHAEVITDFWRAHTRGRWLAVGLGARHDLGLARDGTGALVQDHRVAPLTALSLAFHAERADGLLAGGARVEGAYQWSSQRGWERTYRAEADVEATFLAVNDRPLSVFAVATALPAPGTVTPELRALAGLRFSAPLR